MPDQAVSSIIQSILESFWKGSNLFKRSTHRSRRTKHNADSSAEERRIGDSLTRRPKEIRQIYDQSVAHHGPAFEKGDSPSQAKLAHILMTLNIGLLRLIDHCLADHQSSSSHPRKQLFNLSETAAVDTLCALSELSTRLAAASKPPIQPPLSKSLMSNDVSNSRPPAVSPDKWRPPPSPRLANGGWVRSKSDPSVVSVVMAPRSTNAKKQSQTPQKTAHRGRRRKTASGSLSSPLQSTSALPLNPTDALQDHVARDYHDTAHYNSKRSMQRPPSMLLVPADIFRQALETHIVEESAASNPPPKPPKVPLHSRPQMNSGFRPRPPSMITFMSASTKLGEIPESKLPNRILTEEQRAEKPMPYVVPAMLNPPRKKGRGLKFWKKTAVMQATAA